MYNISNRPDFSNLAAVLEGGTPKRPTLFEFFMNERVYTRLSGLAQRSDKGELYNALRLAAAYAGAGYDYVTLTCPWTFPLTQPEAMMKSRALDHESFIPDRAAFERYPWPNLADHDYGYLREMENYLPKGMGVLVCGADGVLETATALLGYENLCFMLYDEPELVSDIFDKIGEAYLGFYRKMMDYPVVRGIISSDDWGFATQTLLAPDQLRKYVFPWQRKFVDVAHEKGRYAILHSCGRYDMIIDDIIDMGFDARHSYEDKIVPVEKAYDALKGKIAVLGGIDVDFLIKRPVEEIEERAKALIEKTHCTGYALGSGNSIPDYVPDEKYFAMIRCAGVDIVCPGDGM